GCHGNRLHVMERDAEAISTLERARDLLAPLMRDHPDDIGYRSRLGAVLNDLGLALDALDRQAEAVEAFRAAMTQQRVAVTKAPEVAQHRRFFRNHVHALSNVLLELDRLPEAVAAYREAYVLYTQIARDHSTDFEIQADFAMICNSFGNVQEQSGNIE